MCVAIFLPININSVSQPSPTEAQQKKHPGIVLLVGGGKQNQISPEPLLIVLSNFSKGLLQQEETSSSKLSESGFVWGGG